MATYDEPNPSALHGLPEPRPSALSAEHWQGCAEGELRVQRCDDCGHYEFPPQPLCSQCQSQRLAWVTSSGQGSLYSFTVVHRPQRPEFEVPYVAAIVALDEGWHMLSNLIDCDIDALTVGQRLQVCFVSRGQSWLPMFKPAGA